MNLPHGSFDSSVIKQLGADGRGVADSRRGRGLMLLASAASRPSLNLITWPVVIGGGVLTQGYTHNGARSPQPAARSLHSDNTQTRWGGLHSQTMEG